MKSTPFSVNVRYQADKAILELDGEINAFAEQTLLEAYREAESKNPATIVLSFERVSYINSTGIALIVGLLAQARKSHRQMVVYGLSDHYIEIFRITRLSDFMMIYKDESSAMQESAPGASNI